MDSTRLSLLLERSSIAQKVYSQGFSPSMQKRIDEIDAILGDVSIEESYAFALMGVRQDNGNN